MLPIGPRIAHHGPKVVTTVGAGQRLRAIGGALDGQVTPPPVPCADITMHRAQVVDIEIRQDEGAAAALRLQKSYERGIRSCWRRRKANAQIGVSVIDFLEMQICSRRYAQKKDERIAASRVKSISS
jgi:hypothetical protein